MTLVVSATGGDTASRRNFLTSSWASWAWAVVATLPVPIAHTGSYATTILLQDHANIGHQLFSPMARDAPPVGLLGHLDNRLKLSLDNLCTLTRLTLLQGFPDTKNHRQSSIDRSPGLLRHKFGGLAEECATLGMTWIPWRYTDKRGASISSRDTVSRRRTEDNIWNLSISELSGTAIQ
jgi:hypothetical protein